MKAAPINIKKKNKETGSGEEQNYTNSENPVSAETFVSGADFVKTDVIYPWVEAKERPDYDPDDMKPMITLHMNEESILKFEYIFKNKKEEKAKSPRKRDRKITKQDVIRGWVKKGIEEELINLNMLKKELS